MLDETLTYFGRSDSLFVDLRTKKEYAAGHIKGAVSIPYKELEEKKAQLSGYRNICLYCDRGNLSLMAARDLKAEGFPVINLWGGVQALLQELSGKERKIMETIWEREKMI